MENLKVPGSMKKCNRKVHIYLGLYMLFFLWLFSVSGREQLFDPADLPNRRMDLLERFPLFVVPLQEPGIGRSFLELAEPFLQLLESLGVSRIRRQVL